MPSDDYWFLEEKSYTEETDRRGRSREARGKLREYLEYLGADIPEAAYRGWASVLCPFHGDSVKSGSVNLVFGKFKCHACDAAGDAIRLVMYDRGLEWAEAVDFLLEDL